MGNENTEMPENGKSDATVSDEKQQRERSTIDFPYSDLNSAVGIARTIHEREGTVCDVSQLASWLDQSSSGGTFRSRLSAARVFGLTETVRGQGKVLLTELGRDILDPGKEQQARTTAFLTVPLYNAMYEQHHGYALPPAAAIERQMISLGVSKKQADRARQAFTKSAQQAGFIDSQTGRFIKPGTGVSTEDRRQEDDKKGDGGNGGGRPPLHPLIEGLIRTLPEPETEWPAVERIKWLRAAANNFDLIYTGEGSIRIDVEQPRRE